MRNLRPPPHACKQRGAALLLFVIALVMAASYTLLKKVNQASSDARRDSYTLQQLNLAREALRGYALNGLDIVSVTTKPGRLPCPDYNLDGLSDPCKSSGIIIQPGRLPWRTLGVGELHDADNEPLWYVPAIEFDGATAINSNIKNTPLRIDADTAPLVAIVLAPGAVSGNQSRPPGNLSAQLNMAQYFEDINALGGTSYVTSPANNATPFNDRLLAIRLDRFMPELERRVLRELAANLKLATAFPNPARIGKTDCDSSIPDGLLPTSVKAGTPCDVTSATLPGFPGWFTGDNWQKLIWYAMKPGYPTSSLEITFADNTKTNAQALLFSPGPPLAGQTSPRPLSPSVTDLLEDGANTDGDTKYIDPVSSSANNDQLLIVSP